MIDDGTYYMRVVICDFVGSIRYQMETRTRLEEGLDNVIARCFESIAQTMNASGLSMSDISAIGIAHSGVTDSKRGIVLSFPRPGQMAEWRNLPLRDLMEKQFAVPCFLEDSVRMAALAEKHVGVATGLTDFVFVRIGMGIGACIYIDNEPYRGPGGNAGEFGHMTVDEDGPLCYCGNHGCLSVLASCSAILRGMADAIRQGVQSRVLEMAGNDLSQVSIEMIIDAARENDSLAFRILSDAAMHIGVALADVVNLLNPAVIVFGGPLFRPDAQFVLDAIHRVIKQRALEKAANEVQFLLSGLSGEAAAQGAAWFAAHESIETVYAAHNPGLSSGPESAAASEPAAS